jgi:putative NADH-flavin reductase
MKILILGSTGGTGQQLVQQSLQLGHEVTALIRDASKLNIDHKNLSVIQGNVVDKNIVSMALEHKDAVISALGVGKSLKAHDLIFNAAGILISAMTEKNINRLIFISGFGVGESFKQASFIQKFAFRFPLKNIYADKIKADELIRNSSLAWTLVQPVLLTNGPFTGKFKAAEKFEMNGMPTISRADVAGFILEELRDPAFIKKTAIVRR